MQQTVLWETKGERHPIRGVLISGVLDQAPVKLQELSLENSKETKEICRGLLVCVQGAYELVWDGLSTSQTGY